MEKSSYKDKKVLTVDDDNGVLKLYKYFLAPDGFDVIQAEDGEEGLDLVKSETPDIIITDVVMPKMTGVELCKQLKSDTRLSDIPIIIATNISDEDKKIQGLEAGADEFLSKPFSGKVLVAKVKSLLKQKQLQEQVKKAEKMQLFYATVVTANHKINQPLCVIMNSSELLENDLKRLNINDETLKKHLDLLKSCSQKIDYILSELRSISEPSIEEYIGNIKMVDITKSEKNGD